MSAEIERRRQQLAELKANVKRLERELAEERWHVRQMTSTLAWLEAREAERNAADSP